MSEMLSDEEKCSYKQSWKGGIILWKKEQRTL